MDKKKFILILCLVASIILVSVSVTFAFTFMSNLENNKVDVEASTSIIKLRYNDCLNKDTVTCSDISAELAPGDSVSKEFSITNTGTRQAQYSIYFRELYNTFVNGDLVYTLENVTTEETLISEQVVPTGTNNGKTIISDLVALVGETTNYRLTITYLNRDYNQIDNIDAEFRIKTGIRDGSLPLKNELLAVASQTYNEKLWAHKTVIKNVVFENTMNPKENARYTYDISNGQDESVMAYLIPTESDNTKYTAYIQTDGQVIANRNSQFLFSGFTELESIEGLDNLSTSNTTSIRDMFGGCSKLRQVDLHSFDTGNVTNMQGMFWNCTSITELDLSSFDTYNVDNMLGIFDGMTNLRSLDISSFDTANLTDMARMFYGCRNLTSLDLSNFNTSKVTNMAGMFKNCIALTSLDVSSFDTQRVNNMNAMFDMWQGSESLYGNLREIIGLENFNTSNVTDMSGMFSYCKYLTVLDLQNFNTSKVRSMGSMFDGCHNLNTLNIDNFDTSNVTTMVYMFRGCKSLTTLNISHFDTSKVTNMHQMFYGDNGLKNVIFNIRGTKCTNYEGMFAWASTDGGTSITVNYTEDASTLVDNMIATKSSNSNVFKGSQIA